ncbi:hypothetical protein QTP70_031840, partial [Hemibagrus guttatus]
MQNLRLKLPCRKLSPKFVGPLEIVRQVNPVSYRLRLPASYRICPHLPPAPSPDIEGSPAYQVHVLLDSRWVRSQIQYLVDWEGYGPEEHSWVDAADILDPSLSEDFHRDHPNKPAPRPRGRPRRRTPGGVPRPARDLATRGSPCPTFEAFPCCRTGINTERTSGSVRIMNFLLAPDYDSLLTPFSSPVHGSGCYRLRRTIATLTVDNLC